MYLLSSILYDTPDTEMNNAMIKVKERNSGVLRIQLDWSVMGAQMMTKADINGGLRWTEIS